MGGFENEANCSSRTLQPIPMTHMLRPPVHVDAVLCTQETSAPNAPNINLYPIISALVQLKNPLRFKTKIIEKKERIKLALKDMFDILWFTQREKIAQSVYFKQRNPQLLNVQCRCHFILFGIFYDVFLRSRNNPIKCNISKVYYPERIESIVGGVGSFRRAPKTHEHYF